MCGENLVVVGSKTFYFFVFNTVLNAVIIALSGPTNWILRSIFETYLDRFLTTGLPHPSVHYLLRRDRRPRPGAVESPGPDPQLHRVHAAGADGRTGQPRRGRRHRGDQQDRRHRPRTATAGPLRPRVPLSHAVGRGESSFVLYSLGGFTKLKKFKN